MQMRVGASARALKILLLTLLALILSEATGRTAAQDEKPSWQADWEKTVAAAKKEGQLAIYGSITPFRILDEGVFQKRFPEIKVVTVSHEQAQQRIVMERRADKYLADILIGGSATPWQLYGMGALDPVKPALILPEVVDESKWWGGKHYYIDAEKKHIFMYMGVPQNGGVYYNRNLVNPDDHRSFWDFVNPKWKGKIAARDIRSPGSGSSNMKFFYYNPELGSKFITRLFGEMDVTLFLDRRQSVDWLSTGKFPLCFFCVPSEIGRAESQGLPVGAFGLLKEGAGLTTHSGALSFMKNAPHPNASKVFINWLLSREGQITFQNAYIKGKVGASNSMRIDIPKDGIPPDQRLVKGVRYIEVETPERMSMDPIYKAFNDALAVAEKRRSR